MPTLSRRAIFIAGFAFMPCLPLHAQGWPAPTGVHADEEFCQIMARQSELFGRFAKIGPSDMSTRAKYFDDQKALNAEFVKAAPATLASDVALQTRNSNARLDAMDMRLKHDQAQDRAHAMETAAGLRSPEHIAASRHITEYCGIKVPTSP
jgi:hypothetical protein